MYTNLWKPEMQIEMRDLQKNFWTPMQQSLFPGCKPRLASASMPGAAPTPSRLSHGLSDSDCSHEVRQLWVFIVIICNDLIGSIDRVCKYIDRVYKPGNGARLADYFKLLVILIIFWTDCIYYLWFSRWSIIYSNLESIWS